MKLIGIAGQKGAGKDLFAEQLHATWRVEKFAGPLKSMLRAMLYHTNLSSHEIDQMLEGNLKENHYDVLCGQTPRHAMRTLGTEWRNTIGEALWTKIMEEKLLAYPDVSVVISDVRFHHEVAMVKRLGGKIVLLQRGPWTLDPHPSESQIPFLDHDYYYSNTGTIEELREFALRVAGDFA